MPKGLLNVLSARPRDSRAALRRIVPVIGALGAIAQASPALAAGPEDICVARDAGQVAVYPSDADLQSRTQAIEAEAHRGAALTGLTAALSVPAEATTPPSAAALANYCVAAGEAARTSQEGSQFQAHSYLLTAFRYAEAAGLPEVSAQAAFRLGLVHAVETVAGGGRGVAGGGGALIRDGRGSCATLAQPDAVRLRGPSLSRIALECAANRAQSAGNNQLAALSTLRLSRLFLTTAETDQQAAQLRTAAAREAMGGLGLASGIAAGDARAEMIGRLVETALDAGGGDTGALAAAVSRMRAASADPGNLAFAHALDARIALARGDKTGAGAALQRAVFSEAQRPLPSRMPDWLTLLAQAEPERRQEHISAAFQALESVRPLLPSVDPLTRESLFSLRLQPVYEAAVDAQFASAVGDDEASILAAQKVVEAYRQAEIQSLFGNECAPPPVAFNPRDLKPNEVVLYPVLLEDRLELIYASGAERDGQGDGQRVRYHRLAPQQGVSRAAVTRLVDEMAILSQQRHGDGWRAASRALNDMLIAPIADRLPAGSTLIVVPDSALRTVPFAALVDDQGRYLIERASLTVAPALAYLQPGATGEISKPRVVAAALSQEVDLPAGVFPKLENTVIEARAVAGLGQQGARQGKVIENFRKAELETALTRDRIDILHLATHAAFNGGSARSFIVASDDLILLSELRDFITERRTRGADIGLLVLSACETAVGDDQAAMGLAGAAIQAGATSALASLWQVDDIGTASLMKTFYDKLRAGESKADALRSAQTAMIASGGRAADPWVWSAFTMLGGWR